MTLLADTFFFEHVEFIVLFGFVAYFLNAFLQRKGFFKLPPPLSDKSLEPSITLFPVIVCFGIYLAVSLLIAPVIMQLALFLLRTDSSPMLAMSYVQLLTTCFNIGLLTYFVKTQKHLGSKKIWKNYAAVEAKHPFYDWVVGALTWIPAFPVVLVVGELADMFLFYAFGVVSYEQVAVRYLKMTLASPQMLTIALFTILVAAPCLEEFLFRGLLQTYMKKVVGTKSAILLGAFAFSLFHMASSQGLGNISLVLSLFSFACFLGFIYEKRASLFASIGLHMTFNAVTTIRILFFSEP